MADSPTRRARTSYDSEGRAIKPPPLPMGEFVIDPEMVRGKLRRSRLMPAALALPCVEHEADYGEPCWRYVRGVCWSRVTRSRAAHTSARHPDPKTGPKPTFPRSGV